MSCLRVICWALIFIFKLRFPPGVSIATVKGIKIIDHREIFEYLILTLHANKQWDSMHVLSIATQVRIII